MTHDPRRHLHPAGAADLRALLDEKSGLEPTITGGTISAIKRAESGEQILQISAAITHGSSGGPAIDRNGAVIGLATFGSGVQGFNFLVGSSTLLVMLKEARIAPRQSETTQRWQQALALYSNREYTGAIAKLEEVQRLFPAHVDAQRLLVRALQLKRDGKERARVDRLPIKPIAVGTGVLVFVVIMVVRRRRRSAKAARRSVAARLPFLKHRACIVDDEPEAEARPFAGVTKLETPRVHMQALHSSAVGWLVAVGMLAGGAAGVLWWSRSNRARVDHPSLNDSATLGPRDAAKIKLASAAA